MTGDAREITRDHAGASVGAERPRLDVGGAAELVGEAGGVRRRRRPPCGRRGRGAAPRAAPSLERASQARGGRAARRRGVRQPALGGGSDPRGDGGEGRGKEGTHTRTSSSVRTRLQVRSASSLLLTFGEARGSDAAAPPLLFERCDPAGLWFVDAFRGGALLPPQVCAEILARTGMPPDQHAGCLEPAPPASVWARMTRNLWAAARRGGDETKAVFWEGAGCGLDEAAGRG